MQEKLKKKEDKQSISAFKLNALLEITKAINANLSDSELFILFKDILRDELNIGKAVIFFMASGRWQSVLAYGVDDAETDPDVINDLKDVSDITVLDTTEKASKKSFSVVIPVFHHHEALAYVMLGDLDEDALRLSPIIKHLAFIQTLTNITVVAIQNRQLERESQRRQRIFQELKMASRMQESLLPKRLPNNESLRMHAVYRPHLAVGGDFYDLIQVNENETVMCVADVSGKGLSAAILMANFQANLRAIVKVEDNLEEVMRSLNQIVWESSLGDRYITCFLAKYFHKERRLVYVNAAHPAALLIKESLVEELGSCTVGIGMFEEVPFVSACEHAIEPNDLMIFYTDGITETMNAAGEQFQENHLMKLTRELWAENVDTINDHIMQELAAFRKDEMLHDDIALVSCRFL
jgi:sigma-B regulation protein RsbU (phosphoserine phosphatase)